ncbi:MAG: adenine phosphoribosyltransferase [Candidatus Diapherotrites archaeon]|uniref:Adenine phosphoribosyltransferase n=1 Tax=Candidatus Iainarchaeum sp. TaxID=3101447 RepID=A0A938YTK6_9ARCH|nr:adenine phosphoribosyltransferase [Candidatus Diapherotrites archaeon]
MDLSKKVRTIPNFPKKGILFYDVTSLMQDASAFRQAVDELVEHFMKKDVHFDKVASMESRGFILGSVLAYEFHAGFVPLRKPGKLPWKTISQEFEKEYGKDSFEMHEDAIQKGDSVLIVDDLLATGGTLKAAIELVERLGGKVNGIACLIELTFLPGRKKAKGYDLFTLLKYDSEEVKEGKK